MLCPVSTVTPLEGWDLPAPCPPYGFPCDGAPRRLIRLAPDLGVLAAERYRGGGTASYTA